MWIQCVNGQFMGIGTETMQRTLTYQLDELQKDGCNAIIFQVRPECDALYESKLEPWSYYLTGRQGEMPTPYWDPLQWMIDECHRRGMELHAWINPYRAKTKSPHENAVNHVIVRHPEWTFEYDGLTLLNPAYEACRNYICDVVKDIVERYEGQGANPLYIDDEQRKIIREMGCECVEANIMSVFDSEKEKRVLRHDTQKLASAIFKIVRRLGGD